MKEKTLSSSVGNLELFANFDQFTADMLGSPDLVEEASLSGSGKLFNITSPDCTNPDKTVVFFVLVLTNKWLKKLCAPFMMISE